MIQLLSKAQYKRSEKGEFHHIAHRTVEETISLIRSYPWKTERSLASVELTCPSITIEHPIGTYLKIGPYFSDKYSLYYLTTNKKGHEEFIYGTKDNKKLYKKQDIASIDTYVTSSHKSPWRECEVFIITFKDGEQLRFTSLLISNATLRNKFPDIPVNENNKFFPTVESIE